MGQQKNAKLILRKIRRELRPVHQGLYNLANGLMQHLEDHKKDKEAPEVPAGDQGLVLKHGSAETD